MGMYKDSIRVDRDGWNSVFTKCIGILFSKHRKLTTCTDSCYYSTPVKMLSRHRIPTRSSVDGLLDIMDLHDFQLAIRRILFLSRIVDTCMQVYLHSSVLVYLSAVLFPVRLAV